MVDKVIEDNINYPPVERPLNEPASRDSILSEIESIVSDPDTLNRQQKVDSFVERRTADLKKTSKPMTISLITGKTYNGFIHPETEIKRVFYVDSLKIDDPEIYKVLVESFAQFKADAQWKGKSMREIAQYAINRAIGMYFGNYIGSERSESGNRQFYLDHTTSDSEPISVAEFRGKGIGVCAEKASVAQNLLTFLGYESELIASTNNRLNSPDVDDKDGHLYTVITSDSRHFIYDPTNPVIISGPDGSFKNTFPATYPISEESYQTLIKGGQVVVEHGDFTLQGSNYEKQDTKKRVYGGPKGEKI